MADQAKNICDQTVYAVSGIAKIPKVYKLLFLDQPGSLRGQLAVAIGRKNFTENGRFVCAVPGDSQDLSEDLRSFLAERSLPDDDLATERLEALEHDIGGFNVIVCLNGHYLDYLPRIPFHTAALNWDLSTDDRGNNLSDLYRSLHGEISNLLTLITGDDAD